MLENNSKYLYNKEAASNSTNLSNQKIPKKRMQKKNMLKHHRKANSKLENFDEIKKAKQSNSKSKNGLYFLLKHELIAFCQNTTMRGIPRIIKAQSRNLRILWITFVVILFIGLLLSMLFLTKQYLEYNVIHPPVILPDQEPPFPSISLCNLRPLSRFGLEFLKKNNWRNPREFGNNLNVYVANKWYYNQSTKHYYTQFTTAISMNGYLESVPFDVLDKLGHSLDELVIHCLVIYNVGSKREIQKCGSLGHWTKTTHALYLNCHSLTIYPELRNHIKSVIMYIYLDEILKTQLCADCFMQELKSQLSGALVVVHTSDTYPDINQEAVNLQPGTLTEFNLKFILNKNKAPPYGRCSEYTETHIKLHNHNYIYSEHACQLTTIQREINDICRCNAIEYPIFNLSLPFCSALPSFILRKECISSKNKKVVNNKTCDIEILKVFNNLGCKNNITIKYRSDVVAKCTLPCSYYSYASDRSTSTWPTKSFQLNLINSEKAKELRKKEDFKPYLTLINISNEGHETKALEMLEKLNVLERNLLGIMINRPNNKVHVVEEKEVLSLTSYLSQTGGLFSIFIGLSIISVVEFLELLIHCVEACKVTRKNCAQKHRNSSDNETTEKLTPEYNSSPNNGKTENQLVVRKNTLELFQSKYYDLNLSSKESQSSDLWILQSHI